MALGITKFIQFNIWRKTWIKLLRGNMVFHKDTLLAKQGVLNKHVTLYMWMMYVIYLFFSCNLHTPILQKKIFLKDVWNIMVIFNHNSHQADSKLVTGSKGFQIVFLKRFIVNCWNRLFGNSLSWKISLFSFNCDSTLSNTENYNI